MSLPLRQHVEVQSFKFDSVKDQNDFRQIICWPEYTKTIESQNSHSVDWSRLEERCGMHDGKSRVCEFVQRFAPFLTHVQFYFCFSRRVHIVPYILSQEQQIRIWIPISTRKSSRCTVPSVWYIDHASTFTDHYYSLHHLIPHLYNTVIAHQAKRLEEMRDCLMAFLVSDVVNIVLFAFCGFVPKIPTVNI